MAQTKRLLTARYSNYNNRRRRAEEDFWAMKTMQMTCNGWENFEKPAQAGESGGVRGKALG